MFIPVKCESSQNDAQMKTEKGIEDHTGIFILVHSITRATSNPLHNNAKISLQSISLHTITQPRFNLEPYKIDSTLMQNPTT